MDATGNGRAVLPPGAGPQVRADRHILGDPAERGRLVDALSKRPPECVALPHLFGALSFGLLHRSIRMAVSLPNSLGDFPVGLPSDYFCRTMDLLSRIQQAEDFNKDSRGAKAARLISPIVDKPEVPKS